MGRLVAEGAWAGQEGLGALEGPEEGLKEGLLVEAGEAGVQGASSSLEEEEVAEAVGAAGHRCLRAASWRQVEGEAEEGARLVEVAGEAEAASLTHWVQPGEEEGSLQRSSTGCRVSAAPLQSSVSWRARSACWCP